MFGIAGKYMLFLLLLCSHRGKRTKFRGPVDLPPLLSERTRAKSNQTKPKNTSFGNIFMKMETKDTHVCKSHDELSKFLLVGGSFSFHKIMQVVKVWIYKPSQLERLTKAITKTTHVKVLCITHTYRYQRKRVARCLRKIIRNNKSIAWFAFADLGNIFEGSYMDISLQSLRDAFRDNSTMQRFQYNVPYASTPDQEKILQTTKTITNDRSAACNDAKRLILLSWRFDEKSIFHLLPLELICQVFSFIGKPVPLNAIVSVTHTLRTAPYFPED